MILVYLGGSYLVIRVHQGGKGGRRGGQNWRNGGMKRTQPNTAGAGDEGQGPRAKNCGEFLEAAKGS